MQYYSYFDTAVKNVLPQKWANRQDWGRRQGDKAVQGMKYFNAVLKNQSYVADEQFSMADITVFAGLAFADAAGLKVPKDCSALVAWRSKIAELPSVKNRSGQAFEPEDLRRLGF